MSVTGHLPVNVHIWILFRPLSKHWQLEKQTLDREIPHFEMQKHKVPEHHTFTSNHPLRANYAVLIERGLRTEVNTWLHQIISLSRTCTRLTSCLLTKWTSVFSKVYAPNDWIDRLWSLSIISQHWGKRRRRLWVKFQMPEVSALLFVQTLPTAEDKGWKVVLRLSQCSWNCEKTLLIE